MVGAYIRHLRRLSGSLIDSYKNQNYYLQFGTRSTSYTTVKRQFKIFYASSVESDITSIPFRFDDKNENFSRHFIKGMAFIPVGIFSIFKRKEEDEQESELTMTIKRGILLIQKEEYKKAEQMLHVALKIAQDQQNQDGITYIYDTLANLALEQKEYKKAEKLFVNVMQRLVSQGIPHSDNRIVHMSLKIAEISKLQNDTRKAEQGFKFCVDNLKNKIEGGIDDEDTILLYAMSLDYYAKFLIDKNHLTEAFDCFKKAYELNVKVNGEVHEESVVLLNDLGTICTVLDDLDSAISYLEKAVDIGEKLPEMKDLGLVQTNLVTVYIKKGMYEEAKIFYSKGWQHAKKHNNQEVLKELTELLDEIEKLSKL